MQPSRKNSKQRTENFWAMCEAMYQKYPGKFGRNQKTGQLYYWNKQNGTYTFKFDDLIWIKICQRDIGITRQGTISIKNGARGTKYVHYEPSGGARQPLHSYLMQPANGQVVHHINLITTDSSRANFQVLQKGIHKKLHDEARKSGRAYTYLTWLNGAVLN